MHYMCIAWQVQILDFMHELCSTSTICNTMVINNLYDSYEVIRQYTVHVYMQCEKCCLVPIIVLAFSFVWFFCYFTNCVKLLYCVSPCILTQ